MQTIFDQLDTEWATLYATSPAGRTAVAEWTTREPVLAGHTDLAELLSTLKHKVSTNDGAYRALVRLAQSDQPLAARTVLQACAPALHRLVLNVRPSSNLEDTTLEDLSQAAVTEFWEVVQTYSLDTRRSQVFHGLVLDTLNRITPNSRSRHLPAVPIADIGLTDFGLSAGGDPFDQIDPTPSADSGGAELLAWAVTTGAVSADDADLLARIHLQPADSPVRRAGRPGRAATIAADLGISQAAVWQRCHRARSDLVRAFEAANAA